jgi:pilus assembly protein Flp/PilA
LTPASGRVSAVSQAFVVSPRRARIAVKRLTRNRFLSPRAAATCAVPRFNTQDCIMFKKFVTDTNGATAIEYGLIAALISLVVIGVLTTTGANLAADLTSVATALR